jgi:CRISPR type IV-associated protein Csf3
MSIENLKITATLRSPLVGDPPYLDALLTYELGFKMHKFEDMKFNKSTPIEKIERLPIPLTQCEINGVKVNSCSDPIFIIKTEWHDKLSKRFETDRLSLLIDPNKRKNITPGTGHLKSRWQPLHAKLVDKIVWFARGDAKECRRLLKGIVSLGYYRKIGYGLVAKWEVEETEKSDNFIFGKYENKKILMKTVPIGNDLKYTEGYRISYGACIPPYWHNGNFREIAIPI